MNTIFEPEEIFDIEPFKKDFVVELDGTFSNFLIKYSNGKQVPQELAGRYTSKTFADRAIDAYIVKMHMKAIEQAKRKKRQTIKTKREQLEAANG